MKARDTCICVADRDPEVARWLARTLDARGYEARCLDARTSPVGAVADGRAGAVFVDCTASLDAIKLLTDEHPELPVIAMSGRPGAAHVVACLRAGARDFLPKPCEERELDRVLATLSAQRAAPRTLEAPVGARMEALLDTVRRVARTDVTVLVTGESGSGKEYVADRLRAESGRARAPFVKVNCAALPSQLLESELFGYEAGAFTGAERRKPGKFELAHQGTLFLDEISEMSPRLQAKLLQVLQEGSFSRLGGEADVRVDVRIIAATHRDLRAAVRAGTFREDLYYRLNVVHLRVPPLRERRDEVVELAQAALRRFAAELGRPARTLPDSLLEAFRGYAWPGNVRELENMIKRWVVFEREEPILDSMQLGGLRSAPQPAGARVPSGELARFLSGQTASVSLRRVGREASVRAERRAIERVLERTRWNRRRAARILQVSYKALLYKIKDAGLCAEP